MINNDALPEDRHQARHVRDLHRRRPRRPRPRRAAARAAVLDVLRRLVADPRPAPRRRPAARGRAHAVRRARAGPRRRPGPRSHLRATCRPAGHRDRRRCRHRGRGAAPCRTVGEALDPVEAGVGGAHAQRRHADDVAHLGRGLLRLARRTWPSGRGGLGHRRTAARALVLGVIAAASGLPAVSTGARRRLRRRPDGARGRAQAAPIDPADAAAWCRPPRTPTRCVRRRRRRTDVPGPRPGDRVPAHRGVGGGPRPRDQEVVQCLT